MELDEYHMFVLSTTSQSIINTFEHLDYLRIKQGFIIAACESETERCCINLEKCGYFRKETAHRSSNTRMYVITEKGFDHFLRRKDVCEIEI